MKAFDREIVSGSIVRSVWKLAWPMTLLNLVNGSHSLVDHILVGNFISSADNAANAAIGVAWQVFMVFVVMIASLFQGNNVLIARYAGRQDREKISGVAYDVFVSSLAILVLVLGPLGFLLSPALVRFATADASVAAHALPYLRIMFVGGAPLFIMFMVTGALQASGQPKTPLKLGVLTTVLNIVLSTLFITGIGPWPRMGTAGAALGTCLAPVITVAIAIMLVFRRRTLFLPPRRLRLPDWRVLKAVAVIGIPTGLQAVLLNLGGALLIGKIGMLPQGAAAQAAYTIGYIQLFSLVMWVSFGLRVASSTIMGQNIGANRRDRGTRGVYVAALMGMTWAGLMGAVFWLFPGVLLGAFRATAEPLFGYGASLLKVLAFSGVLQVVTLAFTGGLQGAGDTRTPMFIAFITQIVILLGLAQVLDMTGHLSIYTLWAAVFVAHASRFLLTGAVFYRGRWKGIDLKV